MRPTAALAIAVALLPACGAEDVHFGGPAIVPGEGSSQGRCLLVATTDYAADGAVAIVDADTLAVWRDVSAVGAGPRGRGGDGRVVARARPGGAGLQGLGRGTYRTLSQRSLGAGSNPVDVAAVGDGTAWVALFNDGALLRVDLDAADDGSFVIAGPIALGSDEPDGRAEPGALVVNDAVLYVVVLGLDDYPRCSEASRAHIRALDVDTGEEVAAFGGSSRLALAACNPTEIVPLRDGRLAMLHAGRHRSFEGLDDDGGIELVDLRAGTASGLLVDERALGHRDALQVAEAPDGAWWLALADAEFAVSLHRFDPETRTLGDAVRTSTDGGIFDLAVVGDRLFVADRGALGGGLSVLDARTGAAATAAPLDLGYSPVDIVPFEASPPCVPDR